MLTVPAVVCPAATPFSGPITTPPIFFCEYAPTFNLYLGWGWLSLPVPRSWASDQGFDEMFYLPALSDLCKAWPCSELGRRRSTPGLFWNLRGERCACFCGWKVVACESGASGGFCRGNAGPRVRSGTASQCQTHGCALADWRSMYLWIFCVWELMHASPFPTVIFFCCHQHQKSADTQDKSTRGEAGDFTFAFFFLSPHFSSWL